MELTFKLNKTTDFIFEYLTDMRKYASFHPAISRIDNVGDNKYIVHETLKLGFIPISFSYPVTIEQFFDTKIVKMHALVMKLIKIEIQFVLKKDVHNTIVEEHIQFISPIPVEFLLEGIFRKHHTQLFKNIESA